MSSLLSLFLIASAFGAESPAAGVPIDVEDVDRALEQLASEQLDRRQEAERWLGAHLTLGDFPRAARAARGGDAELRRRLSWAVSADSRNLGLGVLFLTDEDEALQEVGRVAVVELVERWNAGAGSVPETLGKLPSDWVDASTRRLSIDLRSGGLAGLVDRLERLAPAPATLVLDPELAPDGGENGRWPRIGGGEFVGTWPELIEELARVHRVSFEAHGHRVPLRGSRPWLRIRAWGARGMDGPAPTTADLCVEWCRGVLREGDVAWNLACARALAEIGWPAAVTWFEQLWADRRHPAALEGLLVAASRGRVAPSFPGPAELSFHLDQLDRDLVNRATGALGRAQRTALALAAAASLGDREAWIAALTRGWSELESPSRWMRLIALEGMGPADPGVRDLATRTFASAGPLGLRRQALRTLVSHSEPGQGTGSGRRAIVSPGELFAGDDREPEAGNLAGLTLDLSLAGVTFPPGDWFRELQGMEAILAALSWAMESRAASAGTELLWMARRAGGTGALTRRLQDWCGMARAAAVEELLARALDSATGAPERAWIERVRIRAGLLGEEESRRALDRLLETSPLDREALLDLGALCAAPSVGWRAREALVTEVGKGPGIDELLPAVELALAGLRRARLDGEKDVLASRLRTAAQTARHPILETLYGSRWPPQAEPAPLDLDRLDRRLAFPPE